MSMVLLQSTPAAGAQAGGTAQFLIGIVPWLLVFVIFYVLMIRPQQRRVKQHQEAIAAVKKGDEVVTGGGIRGKVTKVSDEEAEVEIASGVRVRVVKSTLTHIVGSGATKPAND
jgi:preprotein translocase subunit YajC